MKSIDVYGIGNALNDVLVHVEDQVLKDLGLQKDGMNLVDIERQHEILDRIQSLSKTIEVGGSAANTIVAISQLGAKTAYTSKVGKDELGELFEKDLKNKGVYSLLKKGDKSTGSSVILISSDASRIMNTCLGATQDLSKEDISEDAIQKANVLYVTGYLWDTENQKQAVLHALELAKKYQTQVAFSLSDPFCVERHRDDFLELIEKHVDILLCNLDEATYLTQKNTEYEITSFIKEIVGNFVVTKGKEGAVGYANEEIVPINPFSVDVIDTTGAGDGFAAGYLYGVTHNMSLQDSLPLASFVASKIITQTGPRFNGNLKELAQKWM